MVGREQFDRYPGDLKRQMYSRYDFLKIRVWFIRLKISYCSSNSAVNYNSIFWANWKMREISNDYMSVSPRRIAKGPINYLETGLPEI